MKNILEEVGQMTMGLGKLEIKSESVKGHERSKWPQLISSACRREADFRDSFTVGLSNKSDVRFIEFSSLF